jgi:hypothetical protein
MSDELKIIIGADVGNFQAGINNVVKSIGQLESELKQFQNDIKTLKGDEFTAMSGKIDGLKTSIASLKSVGSSTLPKLGEDAAKAASGIDKIAKPAGNAGYALSTMSGVVRDLPFGFIAIQNNLPLMVDSFSNLTKTSGGVGGALKGLGQAMIGPAGIGFAFGALTSIVTGLIQNYGSLGNAIDVIFAKNKQAAEVTATYNKELEKGQGTIGAEIATIDILVKRLTDLKAPYKTRQDAYNELKKVQPDILRGMTEENALSASSVGVILGNANARKELLLIKIKEGAINKVLDENASKELQASIKLGNAKIAQAKAEKELTAFKKGKSADQDFKKQENAVFFAKKEVASLQVEYDKLNNITTNYSNQLDPLIGRIAEINNETKKGLEAAKADEDTKKKQTEAAAKLAKANGEVQLSVQQLASAEIAKAQKQNEVSRLLERSQIIGQKQTNYDRVAISAGDTAGAVVGFQGSPVAQNLLDEAAAAAAARTEYESYAASVSGLVAPAIDQLFTAFENGKNVFQALGDTIKSLVIDIAKAIIKATILKAITTAVSAGSGAGFFGGLFNALSGGLGGVAAPTFGGGAGLGGGLALNGQVVFVQRGTDLVGVLNKGNSQINRVG